MIRTRQTSRRETRRERRARRDAECVATDQQLGSRLDRWDAQSLDRLQDIVNDENRPATHDG